MIAIARYGFVLLATWPIGATCAWSRKDGTDSPSELQEVVVTAQRSVSGLQTTPLAVTALSGAALKALNVTDLDSLALAVPGVIGDELGEAHIAIRGIGSEAELCKLFHGPRLFRIAVNRLQGRTNGGPRQRETMLVHSR